MLPALQMVDRAPWIPEWGISYYMGVDGLSILFVLLTSFISMLAIYSSFSAITTQVKLYYHFHAAARNWYVGCFPGPGSFPVLRLLGIHADPHVFPDRHVGRPTARLCFD